MGTPDRKFLVLGRHVPLFAAIGLYTKGFSIVTAQCGHECIISAEAVEFCKTNEDAETICESCMEVASEADPDPDKFAAPLPGTEAILKENFGEALGGEMLNHGLDMFRKMGMTPIPFSEMGTDGDSED